jgi:uncharacterized protein (TIGR00369 family)
MAKQHELSFQERWNNMHLTGRDMASTMGIEPVEESDDHVTLRMPHSLTVSQPTGLFSAASLFGLADVAGTLLAMNHTTGEGFPLAANSNIHLHSNTNAGYAVAIAKLVKVGKTLLVTETTVQSDAGKLLASVTTTYVQPRS